MSKSTLQILKEARALISDPERWTQGEDARDEDGLPVHPDDSDAVCWCTLGALHRAAAGTDDFSVFREIQKAVEAFPGIRSQAHYAAKFNDAHTHAEVLAMFDAAISAKERRAAS
jgi:hypothetical protein